MEMHEIMTALNRAWLAAAQLEHVLAIALYSAFASFEEAIELKCGFGFDIINGGNTAAPEDDGALS